MAATGEFSKKLRDTFVNQVIFNQSGVLGVNSKETVADILGKMAEKNCTSVPVFDDEAKTLGKGETVVGLLDLYNIVRFASVQPFLDSPWRESRDPEHFRSTKGMWDKSASDVLGSMILDKLEVYMFDGMDHVGKIVDVFVKDPRCHRVFSISDNLVSLEPGLRRFTVISKSDIVRFVAANRTELGLDNLLGQNVKELGLIKPKDWVTTVDQKTHVIDAFSKMSDEHLNAIAVVDGENGKLVDCLSASDLRGTNSENSDRLILPISEFLKRPEGHKVITVDERDTFGHLLDLFAANRVHRVWVIDDEKRPTGVITVTDVVLMFAEKK